MRRISGDNVRAGHCYEFAALWALGRLLDTPRDREAAMVAMSYGDWNKTVRLVHGFPRLCGDSSGAGSLFGHAWIEFGRLVYDPVTEALITRNVYYEKGRIMKEHVTRFSVAQIQEKIATWTVWGPWDDIPLPEMPLWSQPELGGNNVS